MFGLLVLGFGALTVSAAVLPRQNEDLLSSLPQYDNDPASRAAAIEVKREGYLYGPSLMGDAAFFPTGVLGNALMAADYAPFFADHAPITQKVIADHQIASASINASGGLNSIEDYSTKLYNGQWKNSVPDGPFPGTLSNYTQDLYFSMERLSLNPYPLKRVGATSALPFSVADQIVSKLAGTTLESLQSAGRLFIVDHSYQVKYSKSDKFGAACTAYFFLHPDTEDFLPLAIATNTGSNLVYTPLDEVNDWLLAKIAFNVNDLFFSQWYHLISSHNVAELVQEAALRTLSNEHPIAVVLTHLMVQAFAVRPSGEQLLMKPGAAVDQLFFINSTGTSQFIAEFWRNGGGNYQSNYLDTDFSSRGIRPEPSSKLPQFKSFPFYDDASKIRNSQQAFFTTFIDTYYATADDVTKDSEVTAWFAEATGAAKVFDFPSTPSKEALVEILTHFAFLCGVAHHALNTGNSVAALATLPFHPFALYAPLPTEKGVKDILPFLPPVENALSQIDLVARFNYPGLEARKLTLAFAYSDPALLLKLKSEIAAAAENFHAEMNAISADIRARKFDEKGLSLGMPFLFYDLDPRTNPFYLAI